MTNGRFFHRRRGSPTQWRLPERTGRRNGARRAGPCLSVVLPIPVRCSRSGSAVRRSFLPYRTAYGPQPAALLDAFLKRMGTQRAIRPIESGPDHSASCSGAPGTKAIWRKSRARPDLPRFMMCRRTQAARARKANPLCSTIHGRLSPFSRLWNIGVEISPYPLATNINVGP